MTAGKRITDILFGLLTIILGLLLFFLPKEGIYVVLLVLAIIFIVYGVKYIIYFCQMARHMVGGQLMLIMGILLVLIGFFALSLNKFPQKTIMTVLAVTLLIYGVIGILRAIEAKKGGAKKWRFKLFSGVIPVLLGIICIIFSTSDIAMTYVFAIAIILLSISRISNALRGQNWKKLVKTFDPHLNEE